MVENLARKGAKNIHQAASPPIRLALIQMNETGGTYTTPSRLSPPSRLRVKLATSFRGLTLPKEEILHAKARRRNGRREEERSGNLAALPPATASCLTDISSTQPLRAFLSVSRLRVKLAA